MWKLFIFVTLGLTTWAQEAHPILALGSPAPNFELPGVDGAISQARRLLLKPSPGGGIYLQPLSYRANV